MKKGILILMVGLICGTAFGQKKAKMENEKDSLSYAFGVLMAKNIKNDGISVNTDVFTKAFTAFTNDEDKLQMNPDSANALVQEYFIKKQEKDRAEAKQKGMDFLSENGKRGEVTTTDSGLQYEVLTAGTGAKPSAESSVTVHYTGTLIDGTVFDSSVERGEPATFGVGQVIAGWTEALQLMNEGAKWKLFIPSELAYGSRGAGQAIGPDQALIFEVELIKVN